MDRYFWDIIGPGIQVLGGGDRVRAWAIGFSKKRDALNYTQKAPPTKTRNRVSLKNSRLETRYLRRNPVSLTLSRVAQVASKFLMCSIARLVSLHLPRRDKLLEMEIFWVVTGRSAKDIEIATSPGLSKIWV
ncbi:MAG: hypothetical protein U7126_05570 [Microcoleus sp.]